MLPLQKSDIYADFLECRNKVEINVANIDSYVHLCNFFLLPHIILFLRQGGDFIGYLLGGELDIVHEGLLRLVAADMHHLKNGVLMAEIHIRDVGASGGVACHTLVARHNYIAVEVGLWLFLLFSQRLLLLHGELGRHFLFQ